MENIFDEALRSGRNLYEDEAWRLFKKYDIPTPRCRLAETADDAAAAAKEIGYPVVLKIVSDILHKSDMGGVKVGIQSEASLREAFSNIMESVKHNKPDAGIKGMLVCEMLRPGVEIIIGMNQDISFGPTMMFGLGGIFVEVFNDVSFRVLPLDRKNAKDMIEETKGVALLRGLRGEKPKDINAIVELLLKVAKLIGDNPQIRELDINPCFVYESGVIPADAKVIL